MTVSPTAVDRGHLRVCSTSRAESEHPMQKNWIPSKPPMMLLPLYTPLVDCTDDATVSKCAQRTQCTRLYFSRSALRYHLQLLEQREVGPQVHRG